MIGWTRNGAKEDVRKGIGDEIDKKGGKKGQETIQGSAEEKEGGVCGEKEREGVWGKEGENVEQVRR